MSKHNGVISPITFFDRLIRKNELDQPFTLMDHQREILRLAFTFADDGRLPGDTIIYSCVKNAGKTTLNGAIDACVALSFATLAAVRYGRPVDSAEFAKNYKEPEVESKFDIFRNW